MSELNSSNNESSALETSTQRVPSCLISIDLESEYWPQLSSQLSVLIESSDFTRPMHKKAKEALTDPNHEITLEGDELTAKIKCLKKNVFQTVKLTFAIFDEYATISRCTCNSEKYLLDDKMCEHILTALTILKFSLDNKLAASAEEIKSWKFLFESIDNVFEARSDAVSDANEKVCLRWVLSDTFDLIPYFGPDKGPYYKAQRADLDILDPAKDANFGDWKLIHNFKNSESELKIKSLSQLHILENQDNVFTDKCFQKRLTVKKSSAGLKLEKLEAGFKAHPTLDGKVIDDFHALRDEAICSFTSKNKLEYYETSTGEVDFFRSLLSQTELVPYSEKDNLVDYLMKLERKVPVSIDRAVELRTESANLENIYIRITPLNEKGYRVDVLVKPNKITPYSPGTGPETVLSKDKKGNAVSLVRDFDWEVELAREVIENSSLSSLFSSSGSYFYTQSEQSLIGLIHSFKNSERLSEVVIIEWPKNHGKNYDVKEISEDNIKITAGCSNEKSDLFAVDGQVEIDGEILELKELLDQLRAHKRYIELPSSNWAFITAELENKLKELASIISSEGNEDSENDAVDLASALILNELAKENEFFHLSSKNKKLKEIISKLESTKTEDLAVPSSIKATLRDYQISGFEWLVKNYHTGLGCVLADDMGLGKTLQTICLMTKFKNQGPSLIIVPTSLIGNWTSEIAKFSPELNVISYNSDGRSETLKNLGNCDVVIASYGLSVNERHYLESQHWNLLVLDEAQSVKNFQTQTAKEISKIPATFKLALSGTPIENNLSELWSIFRTVSPGLLGSFSRFRKRFVLPIEKGGSVSQKETLQKLVSPFILRRLKKDILEELPEKFEKTILIELSEKERKFYEAARLEAKERLEKKKSKISGDLEEKGLSQKEIDKQVSSSTRFDVLGTLMTLRQIAINPSLIDPEWQEDSSKNKFLLNQLIDLAGKGNKSLIFSQFTRQLKTVKNKSDDLGLKTLYLDGSTTQSERTRLVKEFQTGNYDCFFISLKAGGTGLNLTKADHVFHIDPWWNPATENQASDRAYRMGQKNNVNVIRLISKDTVEEKIVKLHEKKRSLSDSILKETDSPKDFNIDEYFNLI